jgi:hypothetical protein
LFVFIHVLSDFSRCLIYPLLISVLNLFEFGFLWFFLFLRMGKYPTSSISNRWWYLSYLLILYATNGYQLIWCCCYSCRLWNNCMTNILCRWHYKIGCIYYRWCINDIFIQRFDILSGVSYWAWLLATKWLVLVSYGCSMITLSCCLLLGQLINGDLVIRLSKASLNCIGETNLWVVAFHNIDRLLSIYFLVVLLAILE